MMRQRSALGEYIPFFALLTSWIAGAGSLYFSEIRHWPPCLLCWWQRGFMYPMAVLFPFAIYLRWRRMWLLFIPMSLIGLGISIYHQGLILFPTLFPPAPCSVDGPPCGSDLLHILLRNNYGISFITIPGLAMIAFLLITLSMFIFARQDAYRFDPVADGDEAESAAA